MNKTLVIKTLIEELTKNLQSALAAAQNTYDIATHEDNKAENKYDTRGLEASYLAGAQAERVRDLKETLTLITNLQIKDFSPDDKIAHTALVRLESNEKESWVLLLPKGGGQSVICEGKSINVVTAESPIGRLLVGKSTGDDFSLNAKTFSILGLY